MLLDGHSRDRIAHRYSRDLRTVTRWVSELMDHTQAETDLQLGSRLRDLEHDGLLETLPELDDDDTVTLAAAASGR